VIETGARISEEGGLKNAIEAIEKFFM